MPRSLTERTYPFFGMGYVLYNIGDFLNAALCFSKALDILCDVKGTEYEENACALNNIACCLVKLNKREEAFDHLKVAEAIFEETRGVRDLNTLTIKSNLQKFLNDKIEFSMNAGNSWKIYFKDEFSETNLERAKLSGKENKNRK
jgi:hypothetical protein